MSLAMAVAPWAGGAIAEPPKKPQSAWSVFSAEALHSGLGTVTGPFPEKDQPGFDIAASIVHLKSESGLTADQLGRLLGVSRRSIYNWAAGGPIAAAHEEKVRELELLVFTLPASTPDERRRQLLDSSNGPSLFKQFAAKSSTPQRIKYGVPVEERLGRV